MSVWSSRGATFTEDEHRVGTLGVSSVLVMMKVDVLKVVEINQGIDCRRFSGNDVNEYLRDMDRILSADLGITSS